MLPAFFSSCKKVNDYTEEEKKLPSIQLLSEVSGRPFTTTVGSGVSTKIVGYIKDGCRLKNCDVYISMINGNMSIPIDTLHLSPTVSLMGHFSSNYPSLQNFEILLYLSSSKITAAGDYTFNVKIKSNDNVEAAVICGPYKFQ